MLVLAALPPGGSARADEHGQSFWTPGQYAAGVAQAPSRGWSLATQFYAYAGRLGSVASDGTAYIDLRQDEQTLSLEPSWAPARTLIGGQPCFSVSFGWGRVINRATAAIEAGATTLNPMSRDSGPLDIIPAISLYWSRGKANWMAYMTGNLPVGSVDPKRYSNLTLGHFAFDAGGAFTWNDPASGWEASAIAGFTVNATNPETDYKSGLDSHLDWDVAWSGGAGNWQIGIAGYLYWQLGADSGSGDTVGAFKSRVVGLGPELNASFTLAGRPAQAGLRAYGEVWAQNRPQGVAAFATLSLPLARPAR